MNILYPMFEKSRMIRKGAQLVAPPISMDTMLILPTNSALHYVSQTNVEVGPGSDYPLFKTITKPIQVYNQITLVDPKNNPRPVMFDTRPLISGYLIRNRRFRKLVELDRAPKDDKSLVVLNYSLIHHSFKYMRSLFSDYQEWSDQYYTVMSTANQLANISNRNQFFIIDVPTVLPAMSKLNIASKNMNQDSIRTFNTGSSRMLLELWKWLNGEHVDSIFDRIEVKNYRFMNFIIQDGNRWTCVNLDRLHWWKQSTIDQYRKDIDNKKVDPKAIKPYESTKFRNDQLQKYVLRLFMTMASGRSEAAIDADASLQKAMQDKPNQNEKPITLAEDNDEGEGSGFNDEEDVVVKKSDEQEDSMVSLLNSSNNIKTSEDILREAANLTSKEDDDSSTFEINDEVNSIIDSDLAELENISVSDKEVVTEDTGDVLPLSVPDNRTYEERIKDKCSHLADNGLITAAEYRRFISLSEKFKTLPNPIPGGTGLLVDAMKVTDEELVVNTKNNIAPNATVLDETLAYSSIETSQRQYIKHTLNKHILQMISHIQNADMIIDNIEIEKTETVLGIKNNYLLRVIPIEGSPTTLRFPIPEIDEDGIMVSNAVKYSLRSQRYDHPIRKVASNKVALCSYYGKFNVLRGRKAANDYGQWIANEVAAIGFSPDLDRITDVRTANVFNMDIKAPRSISSLSKQMREFTVNTEDKEQFVFKLDLSKIKENYDPKIVDPWIKKGFTPIAISNKNHIVYYQDDSFYLIHQDNVKPLGELEEILGLDSSHIPAEYCELKIGGKFVPIGVILGYDYGLTQLVKRLKIKTRRVPVGTRVNLQPSELALTFSDETLVFSKNDKLAVLLLGGFLEYKRVIRGFSITDFDNKGVYQNVLDTIGGGTRLLREINNAKALFVDPITHKVLTMKKQPTDFMGILVYSTELLMNDMHRPEYDMSEQRIRGYERIAGSIYTELIRSIKTHNARPGKSRYPLEMKPYAIWQHIADDQALIVVKDINPIANLKIREEVTFSGNGGRSKDTMTAASRAYGENDDGIISEATKDSGEVGINTYRPPNPLLVNTLGMAMPSHEKELHLSSILSTSVLACAGATHDDERDQ